ncbi:MAG: lysylphosphatidylglycerol synthase transmembrane domain-containing protein, partial [Fibrobacterota bacterium]
MDLIKRINRQSAAGGERIWRVVAGRHFINVAKIILTLAFVYLANRKLNLGQLSRLWTDFKLFPFAVASVLGAAAIILHIARWKLLLVYEGFEVSSRVAAKTFLFGLLLAFITPGRLGELFRGLEISKKDRASTFLPVVVDKLFTIAAVFLFAFGCVLMQAVFFKRLPHAQFGVLLAIAAVISLIVLILVARGTLFSKFLKRYGPQIKDLSPRLFSSTGKKVGACTLGAHVALIAQTVVIFRMFGDVGYIEGILAAGQAYAFLTLMPFFMANMGIREYSFQLFIQQFYFAGEMTNITGLALNTSILILMLNLIIPASIGLIWS